MRSVMCHRHFTEQGWNAQEPSEIGIDDFQSNRSLDETYGTSFLRGQRGFYHDGRFATGEEHHPTLDTVVDKYPPGKNTISLVDVANQVTNHLRWNSP